jgi:hypothetical protein
LRIASTPWKRGRSGDRETRGDECIRRFTHRMLRAQIPWRSQK